ncbi:hypothetical protein V8Z74_22800 [Comamonas sp. w2-DMI]|uniref:Uncharacterized protein n=1 Tax=Comamonas terrae TaxID=673548 RepID=A0ABW5URH3_9BURK|nr:hypothetical protein [Comamonas terrae]
MHKIERSFVFMPSARLAGHPPAAGIFAAAVAVPHKMNPVYVNVNAVIMKEPQQ